MVKKRGARTKTPLVQLMLDSGAFSVWNRGGEIDIHQYIDYVKRNEHLLFSYVNLDVIPGVFGRPRSQQEVEDSARGSYENLQIMKDAGLRPIPVFHQHERIYWLERMLADGEDYIGITLSKENKSDVGRGWLDDIFTLLTDNKGRPYVKTHGFGITSPAHLLRYPWYTTDSTTWALSPAYGKIFIPIWENGRFNYRKPPIHIQISGVQTKSGQKRQFEALGRNIQDMVLRYLEEECDLSIAKVRYDINSARREVTLLYYQKLCEALTDTRYKGQRLCMVNGVPVEPLPGLKVQKPFNPSIMYATRFDNRQSYVLNKTGANTRLLSYYELREYPDEVLEEYVRTGFYKDGGYEQRKPRSDLWNEELHNWRRACLIQRVEDQEQEEGA